MNDEKINNAEQRRKALALEILTPGFSQKEFAERWGVADPQISLDKKSKEFLSARNGHLVEKSIEVLMKALEDDDRKVAMFVLDKMNALQTDEPTDTNSQASDLLSRIFRVPDDTAALRRENEQLKARLAAIEQRLSALNGIGADILNTIPSTDTGEASQ